MVFFSVKNQRYDPHIRKSIAKECRHVSYHSYPFSMNTASDNEQEDEIFDDDDESGR